MSEILTFLISPRNICLLESLNFFEETMEKYIPELSSIIEAASLFTPVDIEKEFDLTEGNLNHGEMTLDQFMFMRPTMSTAQYKTPIKNLYMCGSSTHPGGGVMGAPGANAAREILIDLKKQFNSHYI